MAENTQETEPDEGELAADYLEELLDIADLDGDIEIEVKNGRTYLSVASESTDDLRPLSKPDVVQSLQELTRLAVQQKMGEFSRLILDVAGSRDRRAEVLKGIVEAAIMKIEEGAISATLPSMSSYERKLVHDLVAARGYGPELHGEGADRHAVITWAD